MNELNQWLSALRKASAPNPDKLAACHPGAFRSSRWTCCLQAERSGEGAGRGQVPPSPAVNQRVPRPPPMAGYLTFLCASLSSSGEQCLPPRVVVRTVCSQHLERPPAPRAHGV